VAFERSLVLQNANGADLGTLNHKLGGNTTQNQSTYLDTAFEAAFGSSVHH
jgi:hypothetical protein